METLSTSNHRQRQSHHLENILRTSNYGYKRFLWSITNATKRGTIASLLAIVWYSLRGKKKSSSSGKNFKNENVNSLVKDMCHSEKVATADIIIVGAGVAGSALAHTLGKDGRQVHVIERDLTEPDRIVGELLQPGGYLKLIELGLEDCVEQIDAQKVFGYAIYKDGKSTKLSYPLPSFETNIAGRSFHNGCFIQRMREKAATLPSVKLEQGTVTSLLKEKGIVKGVLYKTKTGQELTASAPLTIVCDGCFSNLRRSLCNSKVDIPSCFVALVLENCNLPFENHGHVVLADPSPILFYRISSTEVRCLVDVPGQRVPAISNGEMAQYLKKAVAQQIPSQLHAAFILAIEKGNIKTMPNRSMPASPYPTPGALLLGDAFNMRHPLTGGGMTVALSDIVLLRNLLRPLHDLNDAFALCKYLESFYTLRKPMASTINTLAGALYKVFSVSTDIARNEMRQACFDYLSLGGVFSNGPIALLSGLNPRPLSLVLHFFAVAIYGLSRLMLPFPSPKSLWTGARLIQAASGIIFPIMKAEGVRQMFFPLTVTAYYRAPPTY
ncbi:squalene epoxidase 3 isoform X1 [Jatropha curcas]|uniref:squalene epoxidase 3 isoform X1 n=1 Tax=Jatropha curcas TaxID=180498 RepID=UPI0009D650FE|nr:squalene epoxidase 3 isoform X1 [Jatropha curcas]